MEGNKATAHVVHKKTYLHMYKHKLQIILLISHTQTIYIGKAQKQGEGLCSEGTRGTNNTACFHMQELGAWEMTLACIWFLKHVLHTRLVDK